jgi:hypothetical protein
MLPVPPQAIHISSLSRHRNSSPRVYNSPFSSLALPNALTPPLSTPLSSILLNQREVKFRWKICFLFNLLCLPLCLLHRSRSRSTRSLSPHPLAPKTSCSRSRLTKQPHKFKTLLPPYPPALQENKPFLTLRLAKASPISIQSSTLSMAAKPIKRKRTLLQEPSGQKTTLPGLITTRRPNLITIPGTQQPSLHRETRSIHPPNRYAETIQVRDRY